MATSKTLAMRIRKFIILTLIFISMLFTSCVDSNDIKIIGIENIKVRNRGLQSMIFNATLRVQNDGAAFKIKDLEIDVKAGNREVAKVWVDDKFKIKRGINSVEIPVKIKTVGGLMSVMAFVKNIDSLEYDILVKASKFPLSYTYTLDNLTTKGIKQQIGSDLKDLFPTN